jgi:hypothetical protein
METKMTIYYIWKSKISIKAMKEKWKLLLLPCIYLLNVAFVKQLFIIYCYILTVFHVIKLQLIIVRTSQLINKRAYDVSPKLT